MSDEVNLLTEVSRTGDTATIVVTDAEYGVTLTVKWENVLDTRPNRNRLLKAMFTRFGALFLADLVDSALKNDAEGAR